MPKATNFWNKSAARYDAQSARYMESAYPMTIDAAKRAIRSSDTVLDIGCGTGIVTLGVAPAAKHILGVDVAPAMIDVARQKASTMDIDNVEFQSGDTANLPDCTYDAVLICNVLLYVPDPAALLSEAHRLLKNNGILITVTDCHSEGKSLGMLLLRAGFRLLGALGVVPDMWRFKRTDLITLTREAGFKVEEDGDFYPAPVNYYLRARKAAAKQA